MAFQVLRVDDPVRGAIRLEHFEALNGLAQAGCGARTPQRAVAELVLTGATSVDEALRALV